jgi:Family of unknown function (DUF5681)
MQFAKGQSGNPAGRPKGSFSPAAILAEQMLSTHADGIIRKTIEKALDGNSAALRIFWERIAPPTKEEPVVCEFPPLEKVSDSGEFIAAIINAAARGDLVPRQGSEIAKLVDTYLRTVEATTMDARLTELEHACDQEEANNQSA